MENILDFMKKNYKYLLFTMFLLVVNMIFIYVTHTTKFSSSQINYIILMFIVNFIIIGVYSFLFHKFENIKLEKLYLFMIVPIGLVYLVLFPLNTIPDENNHFARISEIASGNLISDFSKDKKMQGFYFDSDILYVFNSTTYEKTLKNIDNKSTEKKFFYNFSNTSLYSAVCYTPQAIGVFLGKILNLPILIQAYIARLFNFLVFMILTYFAIKLMPMKKICLFLVMFFPIVIQEAVSLAPDALTIGITAFLVSYVCHLKKEKSKQITKKQIAILSFSVLILSLCKIVYLPICLIIFLIPKEKFSSLKNKNIIIASIALIAVIINLIWLSVSSDFLPATGGIDSARQLKYIFSNIITYLLTIGKTYTIIFDDILYNSFGSSLGRFVIPITRIYILSLMLIFIATVIFDNNETKRDKVILKNFEQWYIIILIFGVIMLISTSLYLQWTPVGNDTILGIQGRYFIPIYILLPIVFTKYKLSPKVKFSNKYIYLFLISLNVYALSSIFYNFI